MAAPSRCSVIRGDVNDKTGEVPYTGGRHEAAALPASLVTDVHKSDQPPGGCRRGDN
jgi:hypothetical protein